MCCISWFLSFSLSLSLSLSLYIYRERERETPYLLMRRIMFACAGKA